MPSSKNQSTHSLNASCTNDLTQLAQRNGGDLLHNHNQHQPNATGMQPTHMALPQLSLALPQDLVDKIMNIQAAVKNKTTQASDASRLREFLQFCEGRGIESINAFPAKEDLLVAWAASYAGRIAEATVKAKLRVIKREHERRGLVWQGGELLKRVLMVVEELRPASSSKRKVEGDSVAGDVKPAVPGKKVDIESHNSSQFDDGDGDNKEAIIIEDSSGSDSDSDVKMSAVYGLNNRKATDDAQPQAKKVKLDQDAPDESKTIFVGHLSRSVDNDRLAQVFAQCGGVESANVQMDNGQSRRFGYIRFTTSEAVEKALLMNGQKINGVAVIIDRYERAKDFGDSPPSNKRLYVGNLSSNVSEDTVRSFFDGYGVKSVRLPIDRDTGRHKGFAFLEFEDADSAKKAIEAKNGSYIKGQSIRMDYYREFSGGSRGGRGGRAGFGERGGRGYDRGRGRGAPRGMGGVATFEGKKIVFEFNFEDKKTT